MPSGESLWELIERRVDATPDSMMVVDGDMRVMTFAEFWHEAELAAAGLLAAGIDRRDVVSWQLPTTIESMVLVAALARIEVVQNPISPQVTVDEVMTMTSRVGSALLVAPGHWDSGDVDVAMATASRDNPALRLLVLDGALPQGDVSSLPTLPDRWAPRGVGDHDRHGETDSGASDRSADWMFHSSDVAGRTRWVCHDHLALSAAAGGLVRRLGLIERDRNALVVPLSSIDGVLWLFASLQSGCANVLVDPNEPDETIDVLSREGVTLIGSDETFREVCVDAQRRSLEPLFPDLRAFVGRCSNRSDDSYQSVSDLFGAPILSYYGPVEAPVTAMVDLVDPDHVIRTTEGRVQYGVELRVTGPDGSDVGPGVEGELRVRGPHMMLGYHDRSEGAYAVDRDGLLRTGDLGVVDPDGYLTVTGRLGTLDIGDDMGDDVVVDVSDGTYRLR